MAPSRAPAAACSSGELVSSFRPAVSSFARTSSALSASSLLTYGEPLSRARAARSRSLPGQSRAAGAHSATASWPPAGPAARSRSTRPGCAPSPAARGSPSSSPRRRSRAATAPCAAARAPARAAASVAPAVFARRDRVEHVDQRRRRRGRSARACGPGSRRRAPGSSASGYGWHTWQARAMFSSGLRTQWSRDLHRAFALVRHVAVGAGDAAARVDALAPHLELRVLRLEHVGAGLGVLPVEERWPSGNL